MTTSEIDNSFNNPSIARPTLRYGRPAPQHISQRVTLRVADLFAAFPCLGIENAIVDGSLDTVSKYATVVYDVDAVYDHDPVRLRRFMSATLIRADSICQRLICQIA